MDSGHADEQHEQAAHGPHESRSAMIVARFTYACDAASAGSRSTTGWPAANASAVAAVRGTITSNTMLRGRCCLTYSATRTQAAFVDSYMVSTRPSSVS